MLACKKHKLKNHTFINFLTSTVFYLSGSGPASAQALFNKEHDSLYVLHHVDLLESLLLDVNPN